MHQFNHLSQTSTGEYPLHLVAQHGGSLDLVKVLVEADGELVTLKIPLI